MAAPGRAYLPTGDEIYRDYLSPLGAALGQRIATGTKVTSISQAGIDKVTTKGRDQKAFELRVVRDGREDRAGARGYRCIRHLEQCQSAWIVWPAGIGRSAGRRSPRLWHARCSGRPARGICGESRRRRRRRILGDQRLLDLVKLAEEAPGTTPHWIVRGTNLNKIYGGGSADRLEARGALGTRLKGIGRCGPDPSADRLCDARRRGPITASFSLSACRGASAYRCRR